MILTFSNWKITKPSGTLGYQHDNDSQVLTLGGILPEGYTWDALVQSGQNFDVWNLEPSENGPTITLSEDNLANTGEYYVQIRGTNGEVVQHTNIVSLYVPRSLVGPGTWPTLPTEWIQAEKDIKELNAHPPVPGLNGYWLLWDLSSHSYQESDLPVPVGPAGPPNVLEIGTVETLPADQPATASITGESPAQKLNLGIPQGKQGATGNPGAPGKDGKNGVTPTLAAGNVETLDPDQPATASVTGAGPAYQINLGIPRGQTGAQGTHGKNGKDGQTPTISVGTVTTLDPGQDATAEITGETPNLVLSLGIPKGPPGQDGVQLNDNAVNTSEAWSSKKIVDTLCPSFSVSGNPVVCHPVEGYPLSAVVTLKPKQAGTGDPSPDNVRPISGYDSLAVNVRGRNLADYTKARPRIDSQTVEIIPNGVKWSGDYYFTIPITGLPKGSTIVCTYTSELAGQWNIQYADGTFTPDYAAPGRSITISQNKLARNVLIYSSTPTQVVTNAIFTNIQLEFGSTPTSYEPYQPGTTATLTFPETIYGGTVDAVTGAGEKVWEYIEFDGTESWFTWGPNSGADGVTGFYHFCSIDGDPLEPRMISSILLFKPKAYGGTEVGCAFGDLGGVNSYIIFSVSNSILSDVSSNQAAIDSWESYLSAQASAGTPVQVAYKLATPEPFQATGNQALPAVAGLNTVYTDGDSLEVTGRQDLLYTLQTMQAQTTNLNRFIAEGGTQ